MYTCRHHGAATGDCRIYAERPRMCRDYPYGRAGQQPECTAEHRGVAAALLPLRIEPSVSADDLAGASAAETTACKARRIIGRRAATRRQADPARVALGARSPPPRGGEAGR